MKVFARFELSRGRLDPGDTALLVEGRWPAEPTAFGRQQPIGRFSLDREIDSRFGWIDPCAAEMAEQFAALGHSDLDPGAASTAWLHVVKLRYLLVKLLRVAAFFQSPSRAMPAVYHLFFESGRDLCYVRLLRALARQQGFGLVEHDTGSAETPASVSRKVASSETWRRAAQRLLGPVQPAVAPGKPRLVLCGNPRLLAPVCRELICREMQPWWLAERFAPRSWLRWRRFGVGLLGCDGGARTSDRPAAPQILDYPATRSAASNWPTIDLFAPAVAAWLQEVRAESGHDHAIQAAQIGAHLDRLRPLHVVLDQDGSPFHRAVIAAARDRGVQTSIVQHGAPFIRFGFAPLVADRFCAWGETSREQLVRWGVPEERITATGTAQTMPARQVSRRPMPAHGPRFALLATLAPADSRPDAVNYHLTGETFPAMIRGALAAIADWPGAQLTIKLHPRDRRSPAIRAIAAEFTDLKIKIVAQGALDRVLRRADCVLSCASSAGIEAAAAGWPVIQLMPAGSSELLNAKSWGLVGTARGRDELEELIRIVLAGSPLPHPNGTSHVIAASGPTGARRIVDALLSPVATPARSVTVDGDIPTASPAAETICV